MSEVMHLVCKTGDSGPGSIGHYMSASELILEKQRSSIWGSLNGDKTLKW